MDNLFKAVFSTKHFGKQKQVSVYHFIPSRDLINLSIASTSMKKRVNTVIRQRYNFSYAEYLYNPNSQSRMSLLRVGHCIEDNRCLCGLKKMVDDVTYCKLCARVSEVTKTAAKSVFGLAETEIQKVSVARTYKNYYRRKVSLYSVNVLKAFSLGKYGSLSNWRKELLNRITRQEKRKKPKRKFGPKNMPKWIFRNSRWEPTRTNPLAGSWKTVRQYVMDKECEQNGI